MKWKEFIITILMGVFLGMTIQHHISRYEAREDFSYLREWNKALTLSLYNVLEKGRK